jgi:subfamily B ATP-binding cassette protein MsbA
MKVLQRCAELWNAPLAGEIRRALGYFSEDRQSLALLIALTALSTAVGLLQAWPLAIMIDTLVSSSPVNDWVHRWFLAPLPSGPLMQIGGLAAIALALRLLQELLNAARKLLRMRIDYNGVLRVRCDLFRKMQALHLGYHRSQPLGDQIFRLTTDAFGCPQVLGVLTGAAFSIVTLSIILTVQVARSPMLTLLALAAVPPLIWANVRFGRSLEKRTAAAKKADSAFLGAVHRSLGAISLIQSFGRETDEYHRFGSQARGCIRSWLRIHRQEVGYSLAVGGILGLDGALILAYGGYLIQERMLTPGELMVFMSYLGLLYDPICQMTGLNFNLQTGLAGARRVFEVLDREAMVTDLPGAISLRVQPRALTFHDVDFSYAAGAPVLRGLNLAIPAGSSVAFVGSSGVGKSTLLSLLPRFYDPTAGTIALDGRDVRSIRLADLRKHVALALQDSILLPTTIWENIAYGRPRAAPGEVLEAARLAGASEFIEALPRGYETEVSEGAQNLSGGQRQRIAIARALLTAAPILVLDEPTSFQDGFHEEQLARTLRELRGTRTLIVVSHRIHTIKDCDLICVLEGGAIREMGTHDVLLQRQGLYSKLAAAVEPRAAA